MTAESSLLPAALVPDKAQLMEQASELIEKATGSVEHRIVERFLQSASSAIQQRRIKPTEFFRSDQLRDGFERSFEGLHHALLPFAFSCAPKSSPAFEIFPCSPGPAEVVGVRAFNRPKEIEVLELRFNSELGVEDGTVPFDWGARYGIPLDDRERAALGDDPQILLERHYQSGIVLPINRDSPLLFQVRNLSDVYVPMMGALIVRYARPDPAVWALEWHSTMLDQLLSSPR